MKVRNALVKQFLTTSNIPLILLTMPKFYLVKISLHTPVTFGQDESVLHITHV